MTTNIDIVGIGDKKNLPEKEGCDFKDMDEYLNIAKKIISSYAPKIRFGLAEEMLRNDDAVANIAHSIMMADWQFDGRGTLFGFRKQRARFAIRCYITRKAKQSKHRELQLDNPINLSMSEDSFMSGLSDDGDTPYKTAEKNEAYQNLMGKLTTLTDKGIVSDVGVMYLKQHYMEDMTLEEIAQKRSVSRQSVEQRIKRTLKSLRSAITQEDF